MSTPRFDNLRLSKLDGRRPPHRGEKNETSFLESPLALKQVGRRRRPQGEKNNSLFFESFPPSPP